MQYWLGEKSEENFLFYGFPPPFSGLWRKESHSMSREWSKREAEQKPFGVLPRDMPKVKACLSCTQRWNLNITPARCYLVLLCCWNCQIQTLMNGLEKNLTFLREKNVFRTLEHFPAFQFIKGNWKMCSALKTEILSFIFFVFENICFSSTFLGVETLRPSVLGSSRHMNLAWPPQSPLGNVGMN